jgi:hypothetical protein
MQLIPRFRSWISANYPGTLLSLSEYSIDSGQKSIVDAIAEMDVLGIFGREPLDFASMWNPPAPQDPIAYAFRIFRNYDGNGSQFGDTSLTAISSDQGQLSIYAAQRSSDNAVTILAINKTTAALAGSIALSNLSLPPSAQVYTYSQASLTSIVHASDAAIASGALTYTFPGYSAVLFIVQPAAADVTATTTTLSASAVQITAGQSVTFSVGVAAAAGPTPSGTVTLLDGSTSLGTSSLSNGTVTFTITSLTVGTHSITASYAGDSADAASTSNALAVQVNANTAQQTTATALTATPATAPSGQAITLTATVAPTSGSASPSGTISFQDGSTAIGAMPLAAGKGVLTVSTLSVGSHSISAAYSGDTANLPSTSNPVTVTITTPTTPSPTQTADYSLTLSSSTLTMTQGTPGSLMVTVAPKNGFSASVSFACSGLPSGWACSFAPATLSGGTSESTKMTVGATNSSEWMPLPSSMLLAFVSPIALIFARFRGGRLAKTRWIFLAAFTLLLAGCGVSLKNTSQAQPSTYNVTVTASGASAPTHTQQFVLTITQ